MNKLLITLFALAVASVTAQAQQAAAPAPAAQKAPAPAGAKTIEAKVAMCIGCHGIPGYQASFPEVHKVPMISGQGAKYIAAALTGYKNGDRKHPTMRGIAQSLSEQDINDIAAYYEQHGKESGKALSKEPSSKPSQEVEKLLTKVVACASCHGANFSTPTDGNTPKIAGQHADYLLVALKSYKYDNRPASGRSNGIMASFAKQFSDAELKALAKYIGSLDGELKVKPENKFR